MEMPFRAISRRAWVQGAAAACASRVLAAEQPRLKVAAIFTELRLRSHAFNFLMNLLGKCMFRGEWVDLGVDVVSFYADQFPDKDMALEVSQRFRIPLFPTIDQALCLGGKSLAA